MILGVSFKACNKVFGILGDKTGEKYKHAFSAICANSHVFRKRHGCAVTVACAPIRMNMASSILLRPRINTLTRLLKYQQNCSQFLTIHCKNDGNSILLNT